MTGSGDNPKGDSFVLKKLSKKATMMTMVATLGLGILAGCGSATDKKDGGTAQPGQQTEKVSGTVTVSGSTALLPLAKEAANQFMDKNKDVTINSSGGGSGTGLKNVADGTSDIGMSDVEAGPEFKDKGLVDHKVAVAPFLLIVNKDVNIDNLTKQQAADIFTGKIKNWKEVGGPDKKITIITRPDNSGSRKLVKQIILDGKDFTKDAVVQESTGAMKTAVSTTSGSIGYIDMAYADDSVKVLKFDGVAYSKDNLKNGSYKLYGIEHMYTKGEPKGATKAFLDYIMSNDFQNNTVEKMKFIPVSFLGQ
jgi:phosphate transport system substrate-binding protein